MLRYSRARAGVDRIDAELTDLVLSATGQDPHGASEDILWAFEDVDIDLSDWDGTSLEVSGASESFPGMLTEDGKVKIKAAGFDVICIHFVVPEIESLRSQIQLLHAGDRPQRIPL